MTICTIKQTNELTSKEVIDIMKARTTVFVVEQNCPYQEVDDDDYNDWHVCLLAGNEDDTTNLAAYSRIIDKGDYVTFGRVLVVKKYRKNGLGRELIEKTLNEIKNRFPSKPIKIQAQSYLKDFYGSFGFEQISDIYLEDGIPHMDMILKTI